jgi:hypothetical protein
MWRCDHHRLASSPGEKREMLIEIEHKARRFVEFGRAGLYGCETDGADVPGIDPGVRAWMRPRSGLPPRRSFTNKWPLQKIRAPALL